MFIRVSSFDLVRQPDGEPSVWQTCPCCGVDMTVHSLHCEHCGCNVAWGSDPFKEPEAEEIAREEFLARKQKGWWRCKCGAELPDLAGVDNVRTRVKCPKCGAWYQFDYYALNRWPGDRGTGGLEPREVKTMR